MVRTPLTQTVRVWIDDPNPVFRRGLAFCLTEAGYEVVGESCGLVPSPPPGAADVLIFDLGDPVTVWGIVDGLPPERLVGVAAADARGRLRITGLDSVVPRSEMTPEAILAAVGFAARDQRVR